MLLCFNEWAGIFQTAGPQLNTQSKVKSEIASGDFTASESETPSYPQA